MPCRASSMRVVCALYFCGMEGCCGTSLLLYFVRLDEWDMIAQTAGVGAEIARLSGGAAYSELLRGVVWRRVI